MAALISIYNTGIDRRPVYDIMCRNFSHFCTFIFEKVVNILWWNPIFGSNLINFTIYRYDNKFGRLSFLAFTAHWLRCRSPLPSVLYLVFQRVPALTHLVFGILFLTWIYSGKNNLIEFCASFHFSFHSQLIIIIICMRGFPVKPEIYIHKMSRKRREITPRISRMGAAYKQFVLLLGLRHLTVRRTIHFKVNRNHKCFFCVRRVISSCFGKWFAYNAVR